MNTLDVKIIYDFYENNDRLISLDFQNIPKLIARIIMENETEFTKDDLELMRLIYSNNIDALNDLVNIFKFYMNILDVKDETELYLYNCLEKIMDKFCEFNLLEENIKIKKMEKQRN